MHGYMEFLQGLTVFLVCTATLAILVAGVAVMECRRLARIIAQAKAN